MKPVPNPKHQEEVERYLSHGTPMGNFLTSLFSGSVSYAAAYADVENRRLLWEWGIWLFNYAPEACHGSPERVKEWIERGGSEGNGSS